MCHECVPKFTPSTLHQVFNDSGGIKYSTRRTLLEMDEMATYQMWSFVFSPTQLGIPTERTHRYTIFCLEKALCFAELDRLDQDFQASFFKNLIVDLNIYLVATQSMLQHHRKGLAKKAGGVGSSTRMRRSRTACWLTASASCRKESRDAWASGGKLPSQQCQVREQVQ